jgi:peptide/nickel transport system substrate-binding protein
LKILPVCLATLLALASPSARTETILRVGMAASDLGTIDPHRAVALQDTVPVAWLYNALVRFKPGSASADDIEPDLATGWDSTPDGLTWTFKLRSGVRFANGDPLEAADIVASLRRASDSKTSSFAADYAGISSIEAMDAGTVRLVLRQPMPGVLAVLTNYHGGYIVSRNAGALGSFSAGTGPFALSAYAKTQGLTFRANPHYFRGVPLIDQIDYLYIPADANRDLAYVTREIDLIYGRQDQTWMDRMKAVPDTIIDKVGPNVLGLLHLNQGMKPLDDIRVRQAIAHAIDPAKIVAFKGRDLASLPVSVVPTGYAGIDLNATLPGYDPARSLALLSQAGVGQGLHIRMIQNPSPISLGAAQVVQAQLKQVGITLDLDVVDQNTWQTNIRKDQSQAINYSASRLPLALPYLDEFFHSRGTVNTSTAALNFSHCAAADAQIDAARIETDPAKRATLEREAQRLVIEAVCAVPLYEQALIWAHRTRLDFGYALKGSLSYGPLITEATRLR